VEADSAVDVLVVGGGPAGAATAMGLHRRGRRVLVVDDGAARPGPGCWTLALATIDMLQTAGFDAEAVARAAGQRRVGAFAMHWRGDVETRMSDAWHVEPSRLRAALQGQLRSLGIPVRSQTVWRGRGADGRHILSGARASHVTAALMIDARGRRGRRTGTATAALGATLGCAEHDEPTTQRLAAVDDGWLWAGRLDDGWCVHATVDASRLRGIPGAQRLPLLRALLRQAPAFAAWARAPLLTGPWVSEAGGGWPVLSRAAGQGVPVGDAALTLDPLSAQGVLAALRGAAQAVALIETRLQAPEHSALAETFYRDRLSEQAEADQHHGARLYAEAEVSASAQFWSARRGTQGGSAPRSASSARPLPHHQSVVRLSAASRLEQTAILVPEGIRPGLALCMPGSRRPLGFVAGIPIHTLLAMLGDGCALGELRRRWARVLLLPHVDALILHLWTNEALTTE
jgi:FAD binding domain